MSEEKSKHEESFSLLKGGKLKLKGDKDIKRKKKRKHGGEEEVEEERPVQDLTPKPGTGLLITSGTIVMGQETAFESELQPGDTIIATVTDRFRNTQMDEEREVTMVLSNTSINLNGPFTCDLTKPTSFLRICKGPDWEKVKAERAAEKEQRKKEKREAKFMTYEKVKDPSATWKTTITVTERVGKGMNRESVLDKRCKQKADRFCK